MKAFYIKRIIISLLLGFALAAITTEISYQVLKRENREPQRIEIIIPLGTANLVARGETPPDLPTDMTFVVGDILVVTNQDDTNHELGPLWIPPLTTVSLNLDSVQNYIFDCSFQPSRVFGIDVREPVTISTRLTGIFFAGFPLGALFAVYSILLPSKKKKNPKA